MCAVRLQSPLDGLMPQDTRSMVVSPISPSLGIRGTLSPMSSPPSRGVFRGKHVYASRRGLLGPPVTLNGELVMGEGSASVESPGSTARLDDLAAAVGVCVWARAWAWAWVRGRGLWALGSGLWV